MNFLGFIGGLSFFLFGMNIMETGLKNISGNSIERIIKSVSGNPIKGVLLGTFVTAAVQSSSAVTVSLIGMAEAELISFSEAVFIIMGANIGTSATAWIISLSQLDGGNIILKTLNISTLYPVAGFIGVLFIILSKNNKRYNTGLFLAGFSLLMSGIKSMSSAMENIVNLNYFNNIIKIINNPFSGIIIGAVLTAVIQSSSASIGILQSLSAAGSISVFSAVPIILGINIGTCATAVIACVSGSVISKKICAFHIMFNLAGSALWMAGFFIISAFYDLNINVSAFGISALHTIFNISTTALVLPVLILFKKRQSSSQIITG